MDNPMTKLRSTINSQITWMRLRPWLVMGCVLLVLFWLAPELWARLGGGGGYSGGGGSSGGGSSGGGGDGEAIAWLIEMWIRFCMRYPYIGIPLTGLLGFWFWRSKSSEVNSTTVSAPPAKQVNWDRLRVHDENFSEVLFRDFAYSLFAKIHEARGSGNLARFCQYLDDDVIEKLRRFRADISDVQGVVVGGLVIDKLKLPSQPGGDVSVRVKYEANYTEVTDRGSQAVYSRQLWFLSRRANVLSPPPEKISALGCVGCGSSVEPEPDGTCPHCGNQYERGKHHWFVTGITLVTSRKVGPALTYKADDVGYDLQTIYHPDLAAERERILAEHPDMDLEKFDARFRHIYFTLQNAWSDQDLNALRPFETDSLYQNHKYWVEEYQRQKLRNVLEEVKLDEVQMVKIRSDKFYDAITCRLRASMIDYTIDANGKVVCGSKRKSSKFSEYWTLVRGRGAEETSHENSNCPNCGAELKITMAGECEYCDSKLTSGQFDWVLSEIQQDEEYPG